jgi:hypothetical protein
MFKVRKFLKNRGLFIAGLGFHSSSFITIFHIFVVIILILIIINLLPFIILNGSHGPKVP